jgi:hypothetical protein
MDRLGAIVDSPTPDDQAKPPNHVLENGAVANDAIYSGGNQMASVNQVAAQIAHQRSSGESRSVSMRCTSSILPMPAIMRSLPTISAAE